MRRRARLACAGPTQCSGRPLAGVVLTVGLTADNVNAGIFNLWLKTGFAFNTTPGAVIEIDNATFHKRSDTKKMIEDAGHSVQYLPRYSSDLDPIEPKWAQAKSIHVTTR